LARLFRARKRLKFLFSRAPEEEDVGPQLLGEVRYELEIMTGRPLLGLKLGSSACVEPYQGPAAWKAKALEETPGFLLRLIREAKDIFIVAIGNFGGFVDDLLVGLLVSGKLQLVVERPADRRCRRPD